MHREVTALARALNMEWPRNVLRHSFISYRIATVKSADQVALEAGNSPAVIFKHYRELATDDEAAAWFNILPKKGQWENTLRFDRKNRHPHRLSRPLIRAPTMPNRRGGEGCYRLFSVIQL